MRKFLSILLAVLMVASVSVIAFSAEDTGVATVTLTNIKGDATVTETYAVGDTVVAYTYLNASQLNEGRIGSLHGAQYYSNDVLELVAEYDKTVGIKDTDTMFPVSKDATVASGHWTTSKEYPDMGAIYYNASIASTKGFRFNADDTALIVATYKVKAAGDAKITNAMFTLAESDKNLTRIIDRSEIKLDSFTNPVALSEPTKPLPTTGYAVSGTVTSYETNDGVDDVTLTLTGSDNNYTDTVTVTASYKGIKAETAYAFASVPAGNYVLSVAKGNHITREYEIAVSADTTLNTKICPIGDADLNGYVNAADAKLAFQIDAEQVTDITDEYQIACADAAKPFNGMINAADAKAIFQHDNEQLSLWTVTAE